MSPMHGTVVNIAKKVGDSVEEDWNTHLVLVEAMKMENEVNSPRREESPQSGSLSATRSKLTRSLPSSKWSTSHELVRASSTSVPALAPASA